MEKPEFNEWLQKHQKAYPALADWFSALPDQKGTLSIWFDAMRWLEKAHADEATMRMIRGVEPLVKFTNWHDTPRFVADHAEAIKRESRPRKRFTLPHVDGEPTFACGECCDSGIVDVFHGADVKAVMKQRFNGDLLHRSARACTCDAANKRYRGMIERGELPVFNCVEDIRVPMDRSACTKASVEQDIQCIMESCVTAPVSLEDWVASK
jgi:hypothetical protein